MAQQNYGGFPSVDIEFNKDAGLVDPASVDRLLQTIAGAGATDVFVISHGWNNNIPAAQSLYAQFFQTVRQEVSANRIPKLAGRTFAIMAILWPSMRFTDESAIPGGAAAFDDARAEQLRETLDTMTPLFADRGMIAEQTEAKGLVDRLEDDEAAQNRFVQIVSALLTPPQQPDYGMDALPGALAARAGSEILQSIRGTSIGPEPGAYDFDSGGAAEVPDDSGGAADATGGAADLGGFFNTIKDAALGLLNDTTYYVMKERAGTIGAQGVPPVLARLRSAPHPPRLHLIGHSFGARLVTAAASSVAAPVDSMTLLQAAYSHYGFAQDYDGRHAGHDGFFRAVITQHKVRGPIVITHSVQDKAVGLAYPIASRIANQQASALGDANDPFGGMGRNGAQRTPEVPDMNALLKPAPGATYVLVAGAPNNLNGDAIITGHGDITRAEVVNAMLQCVAQT